MNKPDCKQVPTGLVPSHWNEVERDTTPPVSTAFCWLVEADREGTPHYLKWHNRDSRTWTTDANEADHFDWAIAAERMARLVTQVGEPCKAVEHGFMTRDTTPLSDDARILNPVQFADALAADFDVDAYSANQTASAMAHIACWAALIEARAALATAAQEKAALKDALWRIGENPSVPDAVRNEAHGAIYARAAIEAEAAT